MLNPLPSPGDKFWKCDVNKDGRFVPIEVTFLHLENGSFRFRMPTGQEWLPISVSECHWTEAEQIAYCDKLNAY